MHPVVHGEHAEADVAPAGLNAAVDGQTVHRGRLPLLYVPGGHGMPRDDEDPAGQSRPGGVEQIPEQSLLCSPASDPYRPDGHTLHDVSPAKECVPGEHIPEQFELLEPLVPYRPALHCVQSDDPARL